jgi:hypothetical protein
VPALPVDTGLLVFFVTHLSLSRGAGTVAIAVSAIIAFCALNDVANPFDTSPRAKSVWIGVKKARSGPRVAAKDGVSPEFIVRLWRTRMAEWQTSGVLPFKKARSWMVIQLGWEAAHRPGELSGASFCDLVNAVWGDKGKLAKMPKKELVRLGEMQDDEEGDVFSMTRLAKNDRKVKGQQTTGWSYRMMCPCRVRYGCGAGCGGPPCVH